MDDLDQSGSNEPEVPGWLLDRLNDARKSLKLPPLEEFGAVRFMGSRYCPSRMQSDAILEAAIMQFLRESQVEVLLKLQKILFCRARLQFIIYHIVVSEDLLDEAFQETMLRSHRYYESFRGPNERAYFAWLFTILDNVIINLVNQRRRMEGQGGVGRVVSVDDRSLTWSTCSGLGLVDDKQPTPSHASREAEAVERLYAAIAQLDSVWQQIVLYKMAEVTFEEISAKLSIPKATVCRHYHQALSELRKTLDEK
jgi:RNA polymerase sigma factor (sigma-70 family)